VGGVWERRILEAEMRRGVGGVGKVERQALAQSRQKVWVGVRGSGNFVLVAMLGLMGAAAAAANAEMDCRSWLFTPGREARVVTLCKKNKVGGTPLLGDDCAASLTQGKAPDKASASLNIPPERKT